MRILICAKNDLPANLACNRLCRGLGDADLTFWLSDITRPAEQNDSDLATMRFFERDLPNRWIYPLIEQGAPRSDRAYLTFPELAQRCNAPMRIVQSLRTPEIAGAMAALAPDLILSIRFSHIFPESLINVPTHGILNVHPGALPEYAGLFAPFRQMLDDRLNIGCTVHWIDRGIDTGPVVSRRTLPVTRDRSLIWNICNTYLPGVDAMLDVVDDLKNGRRPFAESQNSSNRHYHGLPTPSEFRQFRDKGLRLVDYGDYETLLDHYRGDVTSVLPKVARAVDMSNADAFDRKLA